MSKKKTAEELMRELKRDTSFEAREVERELSREKLEADLSVAESELVADLRLVGMEVNSVWDLLKLGGGYGAAVDVLLSHAKRSYPDRIREGILRALATPDSICRWNELLGIYEHNSLGLPPSLDYLSGLALSAAADDGVIDDVIRLAKDESRGADRIPLLLALQRSKSSKARMLLNELRDDPVLGSEVKRMRRVSRSLKRIPPVPGL